jgi:hypothetical protein
MITSALYSQTPSTCIFPLGSEIEFLTHMKQKVLLYVSTINDQRPIHLENACRPTRFSNAPHHSCFNRLSCNKCCSPMSEHVSTAWLVISQITFTPRPAQCRVRMNETYYGWRKTMVTSHCSAKAKGEHSSNLVIREPDVTPRHSCFDC